MRLDQSPVLSPFLLSLASSTSPLPNPGTSWQFPQVGTESYWCPTWGLDTGDNVRDMTEEKGVRTRSNNSETSWEPAATELKTAMASTCCILLLLIGPVWSQMVLQWEFQVKEGKTYSDDNMQIIGTIRCPVKGCQTTVIIPFAPSILSSKSRSNICFTYNRRRCLIESNDKGQFIIRVNDPWDDR
ncbi:uncharacterized protein LOC115066850 isoform X2 [Nannospalax galili]|uniref:uncharacterized protein LOC115066850 isoform X2 n=1 Tax=Nannospalax galili TaxID=1026970 RepID=UPI00111BEC56|nr:uncharacterized protein LOC115066850 isoform X2 [Nannospalax galili]